MGAHCNSSAKSLGYHQALRAAPIPPTGYFPHEKWGKEKTISKPLAIPPPIVWCLFTINIECHWQLSSHIKPCGSISMANFIL